MHQFPANDPGTQSYVLRICHNTRSANTFAPPTDVYAANTPSSTQITNAIVNSRAYQAVRSDQAET